MDMSETDRIGGPGERPSNWLKGLDGMSAASIHVSFVYGGGGEKVQVFLQTSLDDGKTPIDIAAFEFALATDQAFATVTGIAPRKPFKPRPPKTLPPGEIEDGVLGNALRILVVTKGTYVGDTFIQVKIATR